MTAQGRWTGWLLRAFVAGIFLFAAAGKAIAPSELLESLTSLGLPDALRWPAAILLLAGELAAAVLLVRTRTVALGATLAMLLSAGFLGVTAYRLQRGSPESCACFGLFLSLPPEQVLRLDAALLFAALILRLRAAKPAGAPASPGAETQPADARGSWRWAVGFGLACVLMLGAGGWIVATAEPEPASAGAHGTPLRFGQPAPFVQEIRGAAEPGRWRLVYFTCPDCREAGLLLDDVFEHIRPHALQLRGTVVVGGRTAAKIATGLAQVRAKLPPGWTAIADPEDHLLDAYAGRPRRRPFAALLDRDGKVLYVADGYVARGATLTKELAALASGTPVTCDDRGPQVLHVNRPVADTVASCLGEVWPEAWTAQRAANPLVAAHISFRCGNCAVFLEDLLGCAAASPELRAILLVDNERDLSVGRSRPLPSGIRVAMAPPAALRDLAGGPVPSVFVVARDRYVFASGPVAHSRQFRAVLGIDEASIEPPGSTPDATSRRTSNATGDNR